VSAAVSVHGNVFSVGKYNATLRLLGGTRGAWAPTGNTGAGHNVSPRAQLVVYKMKKFIIKFKHGFQVVYNVHMEPVSGEANCLYAVYFSVFLLFFWGGGVMDKLGYKISGRHDWS